VNAPRVSPGGAGPDPLLGIFLALRDALMPFGVQIGPVVFRMWQDFQARGVSMFAESGEFDPGRVAALEDAVALMRASTADEPGAAGPSIG
jgi:hypothetical protein